MIKAEFHLSLECRMKKIGTLLLVVLLLPALAVSQEKKRDKGIFVEPKNAFWD
jgi:hypothetical protein